MAQIKNNQVKGNMRTTTPQMRGVVDMQSAMRGMSGATPFSMSMNPGGQSRVPAPSSLVKFTPTSIQALNSPRTTAQNTTRVSSVPGQVNIEPNISPSFPQTGQTTGPAVNNTQNEINSINGQAQGIQNLFNQRNANQGNGINSRGGIDKPDTRPAGFFPGVLQDLLGASKATKEQERTRKEMERISAGNKAIADEAKRVSDQYGAEIAHVGGLGAGAVAGNLSTGSNVVGSGNAAIASQSASARMDALAKAQQAALEGTAQQLTGQEQAAQAFKPSLEASLTQQQQQLSGLGTAAGLAAPLNISYSAGGFDPVTGQQIAGGLGGYAGYKAAEQTFDLSGQYPDAGFQYNPNLTPQENLQMMQAAQQGSPTYQKGTYGVPGQTSFADAAVQETAKRGFDESYQAYQEINKQKSYADEMTNQLSGVMAKYNINENDVRKISEVQNYLRRQFGEEGVVAYQAALAEAQRAYSTLLTIGGGTIPTEATAASNTILNPNSTPKQAMAAIKQLKAAGEERLRTQGSQADAYYQQLQQGSGQNGGSIGGGSNVFAETW